MIKRGISLIVLMISAVVIIIMASIVIVSINNNNPISSARVATVAGTKEALQTNIFAYASNIRTKVLRGVTIKQILTERPEYKLTDGTEVTAFDIDGDGESDTLYRLSMTALKERTDFELKRESSNAWFIDETGKPYCIYTSSANVPDYLKEDGELNSNVRDFVIAANSSEDLTNAVNKVSISFITNGGTAVSDVNNIAYDSIISDNLPANPTKAGYTFRFWQDSFGNRYKADSQDIITESMQLTAMWNGTDEYNASEINALLDKSNFIGKKVKYTGINGYNDWKLFYADGENIALITSGYVPLSLLKELTSFSEFYYSETNRDYGVRIRKTNNYLNQLSNASYFAGFKDKAGWAIDAIVPTLEEFQKSYNSVTHAGNTYNDNDLIQKIYYKNDTGNSYYVASDVSASSNDDDFTTVNTGYGIPTLEDNYSNLWILSNNTLDGYWLVNLSVKINQNRINNPRVYIVDKDGLIYDNIPITENIGLRVIVKLDPDAVLKYDNTLGCYVIE